MSHKTAIAILSISVRKEVCKVKTHWQKHIVKIVLHKRALVQQSARQMSAGQKCTEIKEHTHTHTHTHTHIHTQNKNEYKKGWRLISARQKWQGKNFSAGSCRLMSLKVCLACNKK